MKTVSQPCINCLSRMHGLAITNDRTLSLPGTMSNDHFRTFGSTLGPNQIAMGYVIVATDPRQWLDPYHTTSSYSAVPPLRISDCSPSSEQTSERSIEVSSRIGSTNAGPFYRVHSPATDDAYYENETESSTSSTSDVADSEEGEIDRWIWTMKGDRKYFCALCDIKLPNDSRLRQHMRGLWHQENNEWISTAGTGNDGTQRYSCDLCDVSPLSLGQLRTHVDGLGHKNERHKITRYFTFLSSKTLVSSPIVDTRISSLVSLIYGDDPKCRTRLSYFFNKMFIVPSASYPRHYNCGLCDIHAMDEYQMENHVFDATHEYVLEQAIANWADGKLRAKNLAVGKGSDKRKCYLCDVQFSDCHYHHNYKDHMRSPLHAQRVVAHLKSPRFKSWEKGIVLKGGQPYCVFCGLFLVDRDHMLEHVTKDDVHKCNVAM